MIASHFRLELSFDATISEIVIENAPREILKPLMADHPIRSRTAGKLLAAGMLNEGEFNTLAPQIASLATWHDDIFDMRQVDLANPELTEETISGLMGQLPITRIANAALRANPNCPKELRSVASIPEENLRYYQEALGKHGNLSDPEVEKYLIENVLPLSPDEDIEHCRRPGRIALAARPEISLNLAMLLDGEPCTDCYSGLVQTPAHKKLVVAGLVVGHNFCVKSDFTSIILSPVLDQTALETMFASCGISEFNVNDHELDISQAMIAGHQNATREMVNTTLNSDEVHYDFVHILIENQSPHLPWAIKELVANGGARPEAAACYDEAEPELLDWAMNYIDTYGGNTSGVLELASHPNFPWEKYPHATLQKRIAAEDSLTLTTVAAVAGALADDEMMDVIEGDNTMAALFSKNISGVRLNKIARIAPEFAPLAAVHPNGDSIPMENIEEKYHKSIKSIRAVYPVSELSGRGCAQRLAPAEIHLVV